MQINKNINSYLTRSIFLSNPASNCKPLLVWGRIGSYPRGCCTGTTCRIPEGWCPSTKCLCSSRRRKIRRKFLRNLADIWNGHKIMYRCFCTNSKYIWQKLLLLAKNTSYCKENYQRGLSEKNQLWESQWSTSSDVTRIICGSSLSKKDHKTLATTLGTKKPKKINTKRLYSSSDPLHNNSNWWCLSTNCDKIETQTWA